MFDHVLQHRTLDLFYHPGLPHLSVLTVLHDQGEAHRALRREYGTNASRVSNRLLDTIDHRTSTKPCLIRTERYVS